jgi:hypothetical protein
MPLDYKSIKISQRDIGGCGGHIGEMVILNFKSEDSFITRLSAINFNGGCQRFSVVSPLDESVDDLTKNLSA